MGFTKSTKRNKIKRQWHLINTQGKILGRLSTKIAQLLMGKSKPYYAPYLDCGDYVVVVNAGKVEVTGKKSDQKIYMRYSGYPGGLKKKTFAQVIRENPADIIKEAVSGMLPKNKLRKKRLKRLFIYADEKHPYGNKFEARNPKS